MGLKIDEIGYRQSMYLCIFAAAAGGTPDRAAEQTIKYPADLAAMSFRAVVIFRSKPHWPCPFGCPMPESQAAVAAT
jgi:hypothetical protein